MTGARWPKSPLRLGRLALNVADIARSAAFYEGALGFEAQGPIQAGSSGRAALLGGRFESLALSLGAARLELSRFFGGSAPYPAQSRANDLWFQHFAILCDDIEARAQAVVRAGGQPISRHGPERLPAASGGVTAYKFRDPDGHPLELLARASGDGGRAGRESTSGLPATVDHTAMSVTDMSRALAFYQTVLGLEAGTDHINTGIEQDRLDGLSGVKVRVVGLRTGAPGPHLELLGYETPRGRAAPLDPRDIAATRTVFEAPDLHALEGRLARAARPRRAGDAVLSQDPDGHWLLFEPEA